MKERTCAQYIFCSIEIWLVMNIKLTDKLSQVYFLSTIPCSFFSKISMQRVSLTFFPSYAKGTIYILNLIMKNSNFSSKMAVLFFKVFSFIIYTLLHAFEPCVIKFFPFCMWHLQNIVLSNNVEFNENKFFSGLNVHAIFYICW